MYFPKLTELKSVIIRSLSMVDDHWPVTVAESLMTMLLVFQVFRRCSAGAIETVWTISHTFSSSAVASAWIILASPAQDIDIQFGRRLSHRCRKATRHFTEPAVRCFNAKCQLIGFILLFNIATSTGKWWNQVSRIWNFEFLLFSSRNRSHLVFIQNFNFCDFSYFFQWKK